MDDSAEFEIRGLSADRVWDHENAFYWFSDPSRIAKLLAQAELYRMILGLPGDVLEFGVFKGASLVRLASFRALYETEKSRQIWGFDAFGEFPRDGLSLASDRDFVDRFEGGAGKGLSATELSAILARKSLGNVALVKGDVLSTLPDWLRAHPEKRVALLHLDMDVREPTARTLDLLWDRLVPGGIVMIDDYGTVAGATEAVDALLAEKGLRIEKLPLNHIPAFIRKPA